jgi:GTP-binding protein
VPRATFVLSAASSGDFPTTGLPEIALVGRSNVGKSSLINALAKQKIARTSAAPGKTRLANYYLVDSGLRASGSGHRASGSGLRAAGSRFYLVDLPGYGYARGGADSAATFEALTTEYFDSSRPTRTIAGVLQLIDARHPDLAQDALAFDWVMRLRLPMAIVSTKMDKLSRSEQLKTISSLENKYGLDVLPVSVMKSTGIEQVWRVLRQWTSGAAPGAGSPKP